MWFRWIRIRNTGDKDLLACRMQTRILQYDADPDFCFWMTLNDMEDGADVRASLSPL
jgi:hypothetical protein